MNSKILFFTLLVSAASIHVIAQKPVYPKPETFQHIRFGKKLPPPVSNPVDQFISAKRSSKKTDLPYTTYDTALKQFVEHTPGQKLPPYYPQNSSLKINTSGRKKGTSLGAHLTKDINTLAESLPANFPANAPGTFAVLNGISYFFAEDGIHGRELWRSDGTTPGTYLVKDINPGVNSSEGQGIIVANGHLIFSAFTSDGQEAWISDGTSAGTHILKDLNSGQGSSSPTQFVMVNGSVFFTASINSFNNQLWKTDGTEEGTTLVKDLEQAGIGYFILELTEAADLAFFIAYTYNSGFQLLRSDGTDAGTYVVKETGYFGFGYEFTAPMQLTEYYGKLFFSVDDGTGRRLWTSDGTSDGTSYASGFNDVFMRDDFMNIYKNFSFKIIDNVLYISGKKSPINTGIGELYKYDGANADGIVLVKELTYFSTDDVSYFVPVDITIVDHQLFLKVISNVNGWHDELWSSGGQSNSTQLIKTFPADQGIFTYNYYNANGTLFFVTRDNVYGNELWKSDGTPDGTFLVQDIYAGTGGSFPEDLTFCNGKLLFKAFNNIYGSELWSSNGTEGSTSLVKDINTTSTNSSYAGSYFFFKSIGASSNGVVFNALTTDEGAELYKSDGTSAGTVLLNDIYPGENWSFPNNFLFKNNVNYFINDNAIGTSLYKTNGTSAGLQRITPYINRTLYYVVNYNITDNGLAFYTLGNRFTNSQELWRSDGTGGGTYMLTPNLSYYFNNYIAISGETAFFIAGDESHGFELWKSDGTSAGTKMVKDINQGFFGSDPYNLFIYKKDVYFGAWDGGSLYSLWKSDGSEKGTVKVKNITPAFYFAYFNTQPQQVFCISNGILYFSATDFNTVGSELWKTNGTEAGTVVVRDINPFYDANPNNLTDVKGTVYFTADDGIHGNELWKSNGTSQSTQLVKDISSTFNSSYNLCSAGGKLYFLNTESYPDILWSSDGTAANTRSVADDGLKDLVTIENLIGVGDKLFFNGFSYKYGSELYEGNARTGTFAAVPVTNSSGVETQRNFDAKLYPNPAHYYSTVTITGNSAKVNITVTDVTGRVIWSINDHSDTQITLPVERFAAGEYIIMVVSGPDRKVLKLVKE